MKQKLHIESIVFRVQGELYDGHGDVYDVNIEFIADTSGKVIRKSLDEDGTVVEEKTTEIGIKPARKFFNVMVHNYDIPFWNQDLCCDTSHDTDMDLLPDFPDDEEPDDRMPTWSVKIKYKNGTEQDTKGYDIIPDEVEELFIHFEDCFEEASDDDFNEGEFDDDGIG